MMNAFIPMILKIQGGTVYLFAFVTCVVYMLSGRGSTWLSIVLKSYHCGTGVVFDIVLGHDLISSLSFVIILL